MATEKQKAVFDKIVENHGNVSKTMREVGYDEDTAKNPKNLTESKGWKELMEEYLPNKLLGEKHRELLYKEQVVTKNNMTTGEVDVIPTGEMDAVAVAKGLDMAYKLKGAYAPEKKDITTGGEKLPNTDLDALAQKMAEKLKEEKI
jgi:hypothetical protein